MVQEKIILLLGIRKAVSYNVAMKLAICIPAFNEEKTVGAVIESVPKNIHGITMTKIFIIDDGSTDNTTASAIAAGQKWAGESQKSVDTTSSAHPLHCSIEIIEIKPNKGLANAFLKGIKKALTWGADVVVNIDADGQYRAEEIGLLIEPILRGEADMCIGDRQVEKLKFMSFAKKYGNRVGSWFLRSLTGLRVRDASSGFRAYTQAFAQEIEIFSQHTYTHENLIQAHYQGSRIAEVPVTFITRSDGTSSRLIRGVLKHIFKSLQGILGAWRRWRRVGSGAGQL